MLIHLLEEFRLDWHLSGRAHRTVDLYIRDLTKFFVLHPEPSLATAKAWLASTDSLTVRRKRGQAIRAFGSWCTKTGLSGLEWFNDVPLVSGQVRPQRTATETDYRAALKEVRCDRDKAVIELLWSCGLRRCELAGLCVDDVDLSGGYVVIRQSKSGKPRIAPLSPSASLAVRRLMRMRSDGSLLEMSSNAIRLMLQRVGAPSAHAWRRGWAVAALRAGVSEASLRVVAGWSSGAMVSRYTVALKEELAVDEFNRVWRHH